MKDRFRACRPRYCKERFELKPGTIFRAIEAVIPAENNHAFCLSCLYPLKNDTGCGRPEPVLASADDRCPTESVIAKTQPERVGAHRSTRARAAAARYSPPADTATPLRTPRRQVYSRKDPDPSPSAARKRTSFFSSHCVCPEPVLVK